MSLNILVVNAFFVFISINKNKKANRTKAQSTWFPWTNETKIYYSIPLPFFFNNKQYLITRTTNDTMDMLIGVLFPPSHIHQN